MQIFWTLWGCALAVIMATATWMEYHAIRARIDGANGLTFLVAGVVSAMSLPLGGAIAWYLADFATAAKVVLVTGLGLGAAFWLLLNALNTYAQRRR